MALTDLDRSLLARCQKRDGNAWREFVDRFVGLFVHVIHHSANSRSVKLSESDVDDLCAEILVAILKDDFAILKRFRGESSLATYLTVISRRIAVREIIQRRLSEALGHVKSHVVSMQAPRTDLTEIARIDNREIIQQMLGGLPEQDATIVRLFHLEGKSYRAISEQLNLPENSIGPILTRARERLRKDLSASFKG